MDWLSFKHSRYTQPEELVALSRTHLGSRHRMKWDISLKEQRNIPTPNPQLLRSIRASILIINLEANKISFADTGIKCSCIAQALCVPGGVSECPFRNTGILLV